MFHDETFDVRKAPNVIFVPDEAMLTRLIEALAKHPGQTDALFIKLCDFLPPKPQWMDE